MPKMKEVLGIMFGKREDWYIFDISENGYLVGKTKESASWHDWQIENNERFIVIDNDEKLYCNSTQWMNVV